MRGQYTVTQEGSVELCGANLSVRQAGKLGLRAVKIFRNTNSGPEPWVWEPRSADPSAA